MDRLVAWECCGGGGGDEAVGIRVLAILFKPSHDTNCISFTCFLLYSSWQDLKNEWYWAPLCIYGIAPSTGT